MDRRLRHARFERRVRGRVPARHIQHRVVLRDAVIHHATTEDIIIIIITRRRRRMVREVTTTRTTSITT